MPNKLIITIALLFVSILSGCSDLSRNYEKNLTQFLKKHDITNVKVICDARGRVGKCVLTETSQSFDKLIERLNLRDFESEEIESDFQYYNYWLDYKARRERHGTPYTCGSLKTFNNLKYVKVYGNLERSPELFLEGVGTFEHFFLYRHLETNEACVHFTYAYG